MDHTAALRAMKSAIEEMQKGEAAMAKKKYTVAETHFRTALEQAPEDYAGLLLMSKCLLAQKRDTEALQYSEMAKNVNPDEAQAHHISGFAKIRKKDFDAAYQDFNSYEQVLSGNPNTLFFKGLSLESMHQRDAAANEYSRYLQGVQQGNMAKHAYRRLVEWGYVKPKK